MIDLMIQEAVAEIIMRRAPVNALNTALVRRFEQVLDEIERAEVNVVVIRSDQTCFCAGADLTLVRSYFDSPNGTDDMVTYVASLHRLFDRIERLPAVTLAVVAGAALGGGLELALACDLRIAASTAKLGLPEARIGMIPGAGGTQRLPCLVGPGIARRLILGAEIVDGVEAERLGLAQWVTDPAAIDVMTREIVTRIAGLARPALLSAKYCLAGALDPTVDGFARELEQPRLLMPTREARERIAAFFTSRSR